MEWIPPNMIWVLYFVISLMITIWALPKILSIIKKLF